MFDQLRRSARPSVDTDRLKEQAADVGGSLAEASAQAAHAAAALAEQAKVAALQAKEWAGPRLEKAWRDGAAAAAPKVEKAAEKAVPMVDTAHDRLVQDLLPKVVAAVGAAAAAAAAGADKARDATAAKLTEMAHLDVPEPKKSHTGAKVFWAFAGAAAVGAAYAAWRGSRPTTDPWAEQPWEPVDAHGGTDRLKSRAAEAREEFGGVVTDVRYDLGEAAEAVGEAAGGAVAKTREASEKAKEAREKVAERAREASEKAKEAGEKAREATKKAAPRRRATSATATTDATTTEKLSTADVTEAASSESTKAPADDVPELPWPDDSTEKSS